MQRHLIYKRALFFVATTVMLGASTVLAAEKAPAAAKANNGFVPLFNGKDLTGWQGGADEWMVKDGVLIAKKNKHGILYTKNEYDNFVLRLEFRQEPGGNNGVGLRAPLGGEQPAFASMEVQILDDEHPKYKDLKPVQFTGAVYGVSAPRRGHLKPAWKWNKMEIVADGSRIKVTLNGTPITEVDLSKVGPKEIHGHKLTGLLRPKGYLALCGHNQHTEFRNVKIKELKPSKQKEQDKEEGFVSIFDGKTLNGWQGNLKGHAVEDGAIVCKKNGGGQLYTKKEYANFVLRFEFKLQPGGNNGIALRAPIRGNAAYVGMESQVLDDTADVYKSLQPYQYHGSIYGIFPAKRGSLKPVGQWNREEIVCDGTKIKVTVNGKVIVEGDLDTVRTGTLDGKDHPGRFRKSGFVGFLGHGHRVEFRNLRIKELPSKK
ncbi:MAG: DUF1080 domain-containing protein [Planctomycetota bacterium]|nr:DUF1080 domain-containing protein [Planctomycetota bacterium]